ncbi:MAG: hypothetical protein DLM54_02095, partial [Acidimicrobiales bacterium]
YRLYVGLGTAGPVRAGSECALLVLGPPRSGKTTSIVIPNVLGAPGAVVSTSTKPEVVLATVAARSARGTCWLFDPSGSMAPPPGTKALRWSPVGGCEDWDTAAARAHALAGAARPGGGLIDANHWVERAEALLGPLLHAAALQGGGLGAVVSWTLSRDLAEPLAILEANRATLARASLGGVTHTEERERSGILSTAAGILSPYRCQATLEAASAPNFDPHAFVASADTVYICAPATAQDQLAPLVVALIEQIRSATYARASGKMPLVFALDEVATIAPLPTLPAMVAEGGGQGALTLACLQDLSQARARWGVAAEGFLSLFGAKVVLPGIGDRATLELVCALAGEMDVTQRSVSRPMGWAAVWANNGGRSYRTSTTSITRRPRLPVDAVARGKPGHALLISGPSAPCWVRLTAYFGHSPWRELAAGEPAQPFDTAGPSGTSSFSRWFGRWRLPAKWQPWMVVTLAVVLVATATDSAFRAELANLILNLGLLVALAAWMRRRWRRWTSRWGKRP